MEDAVEELKKRLTFSFAALMQGESTAAESPDTTTAASPQRLSEEATAEAAVLLQRAEQIGHQLNERWQVLGRPHGTIASWWRQDLGLSLSDSPAEMLRKAELYLQRSSESVQ